MNPQQCMMLEPTPKVETIPVNITHLINFNIYDYPGSYKFGENPPEHSTVTNSGALIYVIDCNEEPYSPFLEEFY